MINHRKFANFEGASLGLMKSFAGDQKHEIVMQSWIESARTNPGLSQCVSAAVAKKP